MNYPKGYMRDFLKPFVISFIIIGLSVFAVILSGVPAKVVIPEFIYAGISFAVVCFICLAVIHITQPGDHQNSGGMET